MDEQHVTELTVRSDSVQNLYGRYIKDKFGVNRKYQRKLVWSIAEKQRLIDSIFRNLPLPLFLVAETGAAADSSVEVIDGMQRLNAIFAYIENEFAVDGAYFDLDSLADTKVQKDVGALAQKTPVVARDQAVRFSNYLIALSVFRASYEGGIDDVFRRINSGGRRLSFQELRQAGTVSPLADIVRVLSSQVRGDTSPGDVVPLRTMPLLSITNRELPYGVDVDTIFWVRHGVLRREDVRFSLDEQLVLDLVLDCLIDPLPTISKEARDGFYDFLPDRDASAAREIKAAIDAYGEEKLVDDFMRVYDALRLVLDGEGTRFATLIGVKSGGHSPRSYHAVFLAFFELMIRDRQVPSDIAALLRRLEGISGTTLQIPGGSGAWTGDSRRALVDAVKGAVSPSFEQSGDQEDFARYGWTSQIETLLSNAGIEQQRFEAKQGILRLDDTRAHDPGVVEKVLRTATAMANVGPGGVGYIVLGVADKLADAERVHELDGVRAVDYRGFHVVGLEREAVKLGLSVNKYWEQLLRALSGEARADERVRVALTATARLGNYRGLLVGIFRVEPLSEPMFYGGQLLDRRGSETVPVPTEQFARLFDRFRQI